MSAEPTQPSESTTPDLTDDTQTIGESAEILEPVEVIHAPSQYSQVASIILLLLGAGLTAPFLLLAIPFALAGIAIVCGSLFVAHSRGWLAIGTGLVLLAAILSAGFGAVPVELLVIGVSATIIALDVGQFGIDVGNQLGRQTQTRRLEITHTAVTIFALTIANGFAYVVYLFAGTGRPASGVAIAAIGVITLMWVYRT